MAFARRDFAGAAVATTLDTNITGSSTSFTVASAAGWPAGTNGKFLISIGRGTASEEKAWVQTRSGTTLTLASSSDRGAEGTSAQAHSAGDAVEHVAGSTDADEANQMVSQTIGLVTTKGDSLVASAANNLDRFPAGANNTVQVSDNSQTVGRKWAQVDGNMLAASVAGSGLTGANGQPLGVNVDNATLEISTDQVRIKDLGVVPAKFPANLSRNFTDVDASRAGLTGLREGDQFAATDTNIDYRYDGAAWQVLRRPWTTFTPTVLNAGQAAVAKTVTYSKYTQHGNLVTAQAELNLTANSGGSGSIRIGLPTTAVQNGLFVGVFLFYDVSLSTIYHGGAFTASAGTQVEGYRDNTSPVVAMGSTLQTGDFVRYAVSYETT